MTSSRWLQWEPTKTPIFEKKPKPEPTKPSKLNSDGFDGSHLRKIQKIAPEERVFPRCPHCASYALYRNNQGDYECMSCGLQQISQAAARRNPE